MNPLGRCNRCSSEFQAGDVRYVLNVESFADVDMELDALGEASDPPPEELLDELLDQVTGLDEEDLDAQVYERIRLVLCKHCRDTVATSLKKIEAKQPPSPTHRIH